MVTKRRWTDEENNILVQAIIANPHNIQGACKYAATKLEGRTPKACELHWYQVIAPANNPTKLGVSFLAVGPKTIYKNRKNSGSSIVQPEKSTLWAKIRKLIGLNFLRTDLH